MRVILSCSLLLLALVIAAAAAPPPPSAAPKAPADPNGEFFEREIRPVLVERCLSCHGPKVRQAGLRLDTAAGLRKGADTGPVVRPGDPDGSRLIQAVRFTGPVKMPPGKQLPAEQVQALEKWVKLGAPWPLERMKSEGGGMKPNSIHPSSFIPHPSIHWAFQPVRKPAIPRVKHAGWVKTPVDAFILARLEKEGLSPADPADPRTLIRRATFDLTGLPPTPEEVEQFVRECRNVPGPESRVPGRTSPDAGPGTLDPGLNAAYERLIDRLLASPAYGERWGRHWLDVVRYADTAGETADYPVREAYRYRNYVIDAFNQDKPYDRFLKEQVAGDLLAPSGPKERYAECVTATGFIACARRFGFDPQNYQHLTIEDTIDTLGKAVLGLTVGCARCHDHKYDPIPQQDYYALYGIFASTRYAFPGSEEQKRPRDFPPLVPPAEAAQLQKEQEARLAALGTEAKELEAEQSRLRAEIGLDGDLELQVEGEVPTAPWTNGPNSPARVTTRAQSPFATVYPRGRQGLEFGNTGAYSGFGQQLPQAWTAARTPLLYYNAEFRNVSAAAGGRGSYRYYVGHGPGNSAAVEAFVNEDGFYLRNGERVERIRSLPMGEWCSLQLVLDLRSRTCSGSVGRPGDRVSFSGIAFAGAWDGTIDYFFVDSYGHLPGVRPAHQVDNLCIRDTPLPDENAPAPVAAAGRETLLTRWRGIAERSAALERERTALMERGPYPVAYAVAEGSPQDTRLQRRGDPANLGDAVPRRFLTVLGGQSLPPGAGSGRLQLAEWLTDPKNPLTARVMVNRVWQHHFGQGLVRTPNDFGKRGTPPTHPELLDYLAASFVGGVPGPESLVPGRTAADARLGTQDPGLKWSIKSLHRLIMLSSTYQQSSSQHASADPANLLLSRQNRRRLEAEAIRDSLLAVSGELDRSMGGEHPFPPVNTWGFTQHAPFTAVYESKQRSVYLMSGRIRKHPFLALFDGAEPNTSSPERVITTTPLQALYMMNDPFVHQQAEKLAARLLAPKQTEVPRIDRAYRLCFGRPPTAAERQAAAGFLTAARAALQEGGVSGESVEPAAWAALVRSLLCSNEFLFVD